MKTAFVIRIRLFAHEENAEETAPRTSMATLMASRIAAAAADFATLIPLCLES
jgi:hypothetical protein